MPWFEQDNNDNAKVKTSVDYTRDDEPENSDGGNRTDFLIIDKESNTHTHISIDGNGKETQYHDYR